MIIPNLKRYMHPSIYSSLIYNSQDIGLQKPRWRQPKCSSTNEWMEMCYMYVIEYYLASKK